VTFAAVASAAGVSRSWLYAQPDIRDQIQRLRGTRNGKPASAIPAGQRATDASLHTRLTAALQRNQELAEENARLRRQLAHALGVAPYNVSRTSSRSQCVAAISARLVLLAGWTAFAREV
jgi:hypothetical protein